jgi:hypothetical protein
MEESSSETFIQKAETALPLNSAPKYTPDLETIFQGVQNQRSRLRVFSRLWSGAREPVELLYRV